MTAVITPSDVSSNQRKPLKLKRSKKVYTSTPEGRVHAFTISYRFNPERSPIAKITIDLNDTIPQGSEQFPYTFGKANPHEHPRLRMELNHFAVAADCHFKPINVIVRQGWLFKGRRMVATYYSQPLNGDRKTQRNIDDRIEEFHGACLRMEQALVAMMRKKEAVSKRDTATGLIVQRTPEQVDEP